MKRKIMIVDDDENNNISFKIGFENRYNDYEVITAESGSECLKMLEEEKIPDVILLDIMMPGMSGWELYDRIKGNPTWKNIPIIFLTARTDSLAKDAGTFLGEDYIEKPYEIEDVKNRIDAIFKKKEQT
ncbi:MAG: response regulator [Thermoplasmata archaeon]|nr:MAG: response regulator [Thermoplasmata archaeon]